VFQLGGGGVFISLGGGGGKTITAYFVYCIMSVLFVVRPTI